MSCTEAIDGTPSGSLLHGIMAAISEFYSKNLGNEVKKGFEQKAKAGGTPTRAKLGYLNTRKAIEGRDVGVVVKDPERAPLIRLAFELYATGDFGYSQLCEVLSAKGLRTRPTSRHNGKPVTTSQIDRILKDRYYVGKIVYNGVEYEGKHGALIDEELFARVQDVIASHSVSGDKRRLHHHPLKGSVYCGVCGKRLIYTKARNRWNRIYEYFYCVGRQHYGKQCPQGWMSAAAIDAAVERHYRTVNQLMTAERAERVRKAVVAHVHALERTSKLQSGKHQQTIVKIETEQLRLVQAHGVGAVPLNILKKEQQRLARELRGAQAALAATHHNHADTKRTIDLALELASNCQAAYQQAPGRVRRLLNQTIFDRIWIEGGEVSGSALTPPFTSLLDPGLVPDHAPPPATTVRADATKAPSKTPGAFSYTPGPNTGQTAILATETRPQATSGEGVESMGSGIPLVGRVRKRTE